MIEILNELTEIPFEIFWDKYLSDRPGIYDRLRAEAQWLKMVECNRIMAFECLCKGHPMQGEPYEFLRQFDLPWT